MSISKIKVGTTEHELEAAKLATVRTISLTGDVTGSANFDGSANASITATVKDDSHNHVISNVDGLQSALDKKTNQITWSCPTTVGKYSRICEISGSANMGILTLSLSQSSQACTHAYAIGTGWSSAQLYQIGGNNFSVNFGQDIRIVKGDSETHFYVEVLNDYGYNGATSVNVSCAYVALKGSGLTSITTYTPTEDAVTVKASLTSKRDGLVAPKFYGDLEGNATTATSATSATNATKDASGNTITSTYETKTDASTKLTEAKAYADASATAAANKVKNDLLNGAGAAYDTLKELGTLIDTNTDAIDALEIVAANKADKSHTHNYAGASSAGGAATSANKLNTNAGSATQPVYFSNGVPVATTYTLGKSVPSDAKFTDTTYSAATTSANGLMSAADKKRVNAFAGTTNLGTMSGKTKADLQTALDTWLNDCSSIPNATAIFSADHNWITVWNSSDTTETISAGGQWTVTIIAQYATKAYTQLRFAYYSDEKVAYVHRSNSTWGTVHQAAFKDDLDSKQNTITGAATTITGSNLTASRALVSDSSGKVAVSAVTSTELGYLDGVTSNIQTQLNGKLPLTGGTISSDLEVKGILKNGRIYNNVATFQASDTVDEIVIKTKIPFTSGNIMPLIHLKGYAYGESSPIEITVAFYIYNNAFSNFGATSTCPWQPTIYLSTYTESEQKYVALSFNKSIYYPRFTVDFTDIWRDYGSNRDGYAEGWTITSKTVSTTTSIIPTTDKVTVSYKLIANDISGNAASATKAIQDGNGNVITSTYATKTELTNGLASKAASSHGNHVPATETANNAKFLRNDNTWQTVTPANIGAAAASHGTHVSYGTSATAVGSTASAGTASTVSRSDHTHSLSKSAVTTALGYTPPTTDTTYGVATTSAAGLMSASDKSKLDGVAVGANKTTVDTALSSSSTNPISNNAVYSALANKADKTQIYTATFAVANWTGSGPYTQTVTVTGLKSTDNPIADISLSDSETSDSASVKLDAWSLIGRLVTGDNTLTAYCYGDAPEVEITVRLAVI